MIIVPKVSKRKSYMDDEVDRYVEVTNDFG